MFNLFDKYTGVLIATNLQNAVYHGLIHKNNNGP